MQEMLCELYDPSPNGSEIVLRLFQLFLAELMDCYERELVRGAADGAAGPTALVTGMLGYIDRELLHALEGMAAEFGLSLIMRRRSSSDMWARPLGNLCRSDAWCVRPSFCAVAPRPGRLRMRWAMKT